MPDEILIETASGAAVETAVVGALMETGPPQDGARPVFGTICSNCHTALKGRHCHHCGQVADTYHRPVWSLFSEMLEGYLGLDGRIWRTIPALLFRPGVVTAQYLRGIRQPFMTPFRLFLLSSLLFFVVFAALTSGKNLIPAAGLGDLAQEVGTVGGEVLEQAKSEISDLQQNAEGVSEPALDLAQAGIAAVERELKRKRAVDALGPARFSTQQRVLCELRQGVLPEDSLSSLCIEALEEERLRDLAANQNEESLEEGLVVETPIDTGSENVKANVSIDSESFIRTLPLETRRFLVENIETAVNNPDQYRATLGRWAPRLAFVLAPAYGVLLALSFFWRRDLYIYDHMIVALHFHAFLFLFLVLLVPIGMWVGVGWAGLIFALWSNYYLYRLIRNVYRSGFVSAVGRVVALDLAYLVLLLAVFLGLLFLGLVFV